MGKPPPALFLRVLCIDLAVTAAGCGSRNKTVRAWGEIRWQGKPVDEGVIVFFPIEGTARRNSTIRT